MKKLLFLCAFAFLMFGCGSNKPPMSIDQVAAELDKAFKTAPESVRMLTQAIGRLIERKQYAPASIQLQTLLGDPSLTKPQKAVIATAMATVSNAMQAQVAIQEVATSPAPGSKQPSQPPPDLSGGGGGNETSATEAKATLEYYKRTK